MNKGKNTSAELLLRKAIYARGLRYRLHARDLPGRPDLVFRRARVVVFVDGDFWHGKNWVRRSRKLANGANASYWVAKIQSNRKRDRRQAAKLRARGWTVVRIWESDVQKQCDLAARQVASALQAATKRHRR